MDQGVLLRVATRPVVALLAVTASRASLLTVAELSLVLDQIGDFFSLDDTEDSVARLLCTSTKIHEAVCRTRWNDWYLTLVTPHYLGWTPVSTP